MSTAIAHVSVDLDPIDTHLAGYGIASDPCDLIYRVAVPRILDLLDRLGLHATFFVIARDAEREAALWRDAMRRGHEIASHSVTHPIPFATLPRDDLRRELRESRARLEAVIGQPIVGFRAPGWDVDQTTLTEIEAAGYLYDASILPSPAVLAGAVLRWVLSAGRMRSESLVRTMRLAFSRRPPHRLSHGGRLLEFPVAVSPFLRVPFTHTLWHLLPAWLCRRT
ncbi:MAG TPA: polysaccharide deacetylase family protein, partial [Pseudomonadales bacterium]|nr:polysaccharide deacetylase family protein [Pseudomonadales bacterium]